MTPSQHTKGPWTYDETWALIHGPNAEEICAVHPAQGQGEARVSRKIAAANARLIACAPELLEALKAIHAALNQPVQFTDSQDSCDILRADATFARQAAAIAIAKAEGARE